MNCEICDAVATGQMGQIARFTYWEVNVGLEQSNLGRGFIPLLRHVEQLSEITVEEWIELKLIINRYEYAVTAAFGAVSFNWACLMNNAFKLETPNPHVHWHVRPRYKDPVTLDGREYRDETFGHHYDPKLKELADEHTRNLIASKIKEHF